MFKWSVMYQGGEPDSKSGCGWFDSNTVRKTIFIVSCSEEGEWRASEPT